MVKKSSFLEKLRSRLRSSDLRVDSTPDFTDPARRGGADPAGSEPRVDAARVEPLPAIREPELVSGRKLSPKEEATIAVQDGFRELNSLLRGMQSRVEDQGERFVRATDSLARLPELQSSQLETLRRIAEHMENQGRNQAVLVQTLGDLPGLMTKVRDALDRAAATDERTSGTLDDFRAHMARIQGSMERMVDHSRQHVESAKALSTGRESELEELKSATHSAVAGVEKAQKAGLDALRDSHADQATRLARLLAEGTRRHNATLILIGLVLAALISIGVMLAIR